MFPRHTNLPLVFYQAFLRPIALLLTTYLCDHVLFFFTGFSLTATVPSQVEPWANRFFAILNFLSLTPRHFSALVPRSNPRSARSSIASRIKHNMGRAGNTHLARPSLLLRVITPTGFSITIRAFFDTGCTNSFISKELADLLLANGATSHYVWPENVLTLDGYGLMSQYQLGGVSLQSLEDESVIVPPTTFSIIKRHPHYVDYLPIYTVIQKMASLGLPMVTSKGLENTMWQKGVPNSQRRIDMLIGQDLLNSHFLITPFQPTYYINHQLTITRTKMGLIFTGFFKDDHFTKWFSELHLNNSAKENLKKTLYPEKVSPTTLPNVSHDLSPRTKQKLTDVLAVKLYKLRSDWKRYHYAFFGLILYLHMLITLIIAILLAFLIQSVITTFFLRHFPFGTYLQSAYIAYLRRLFIFAERMSKLYCKFPLRFLIQTCICTISPDYMHFYFPPILLLNVGNGSLCKKVNAIIDSGSAFSFISTRLVEELNLREEDIKYNFGETTKAVNVKIADPIGNYQSTVALKQLSKIGSFFHYFKPERLRQIGKLLNIPNLVNLSQCYPSEIIIGTDLIPLLIPTSHPARCISILPNLSLIETSLGFYLQGTQINRHISSIYFNWKSKRIPIFTRWKSLFICFAVDCLLFVSIMFLQ